MNPRDDSPVYLWTNTGHFLGRIGGDDRAEDEWVWRPGEDARRRRPAVLRARPRRSWRTVLRSLVGDRIGGRVTAPSRSA